MVLGEGVHDERDVRVARARRFERGARALRAVLNLVVNFVAHEPRLSGAPLPHPRAPVVQREELVRAQNRACGVGGARHDQALDGPRRFERVRVLEQRGRGLEVGGRVHRHRHDAHAQRLQNVPVARVPRRGDGHAVARVEGGDEREHKRRAASGGDHDGLGVHRDVVALVVVRRDARAELIRAVSHRVPERGLTPSARVQAVLRLLQDAHGWARGGLAHLHVENCASGALAVVRSLHHLHHAERGDARRAEARGRASRVGVARRAGHRGERWLGRRRVCQ